MFFHDYIDIHRAGAVPREQFSALLTAYSRDSEAADNSCHVATDEVIRRIVGTTAEGLLHEQQQREKMRSRDATTTSNEEGGAAGGRLTASLASVVWVSSTVRLNATANPRDGAAVTFRGPPFNPPMISSAATP